MAKCQKCGVEVNEQDLYEAQSFQVCEDCKINSIGNVSKPCGGGK